MGSVERDLLPISLCVLQCPAPARWCLKYRRGFFLWAVVGLLHRPGRKCGGRRDIVFHQPINRAAMVNAKNDAEPDAGSVGTGG